MKKVTIKNRFISLTVLDYGAIIQRLEVLDKNQKKINIVTSLEHSEDYLDDTDYLGACVGRYAGRISKGHLAIAEKTYSLYADNGVHLHGGKEGFSRKYWTFDEISEGEEPFVKLSYLSEDLEEGYPGKLTATVVYKLVNNSLHIIHEANTDKTTAVNLTNHSYYNLDGTDTVSHYDLQLNCARAVETKANLLPTGNIVSVKNTAYDFTKERKIGNTLLDTAFTIDKRTKEAAIVYSEKSGICMTVVTNQPSVIIYTPEKFAAICFETQNYPDAPNNSSFPSSLLHPGETYSNSSEFRFGIK